MLSTEQQNIIENSIWVVNTALKKQGLQADEDLRQSAILYMCKCIQRYDPEKHIKWTTFAYKNVYLFIKRTHIKRMVKDNLIADVDVYTPILSINNLSNLDNVLFLENIKCLCTAEERQMLELKRQGYKIMEIGKIMGCSARRISGYMQSIKEKAKEIER